MERLQRVIAARGAASRRTAETLITDGRVKVNGELVTELGRRVDPLTDEIRVDGKVLRPQRLRTILLNKPAGYITTTKDDRDRDTVMDLVPSRQRLFPVGRLDRDTEGLLLLTNDGELANRVMHPRYEIAKEYHVFTTHRPSDQTMQKVRDGVRIEGRDIVPEEFRILRETREGVILKIVIHEGFYHAVRRIMDAAGIEVRKLRRHRIGPVSVQGVEVGLWRELTVGELTQLGQALHLDRDLVVESSLPDAPLQTLSAKAPAARSVGRGARAAANQRGSRPAAAKSGSRTAPAQRGTRSFAAFREGRALTPEREERAVAAPGKERPAREDVGSRPETESLGRRSRQRPARGQETAAERPERGQRAAASRSQTERNQTRPSRGTQSDRTETAPTRGAEPRVVRGGNAIPKPDRHGGSRGKEAAARRAANRGGSRPSQKPNPMGGTRRRRKTVRGNENA